MCPEGCLFCRVRMARMVGRTCIETRENPMRCCCCCCCCYVDDRSDLLLRGADGPFM
jgi:hypothetical protein